ncbi:hypothetical protein [Streptomyces sp. NBC_01304]|uniref:hypothetical protein n=1 Tax=Streptomyces sp. NBC_01304 TaxID=2903818 RepID=UPI002E0ED288|nr:hypothetical protein OG430_16965 [Streptomyces sp. NBC_01304]
MSSIIKRRIVAAGTVITALGALGAGTTGTASAQSVTPAALSCESGHLCMKVVGQLFPVSIPADRPYSFGKAVDVTEYVNNSDMGFCADANPNFGIKPGESYSLSVRTGVVSLSLHPTGEGCLG